MDSIIKKIRSVLRNAGFETYYPGQHEGECISEYLVISYDGSTDIDGSSSVADTYSVMCYVPQKKYSRTVELAGDVRKVMRRLFPLVRETGVATPFFDESAAAFMINVSYVNYRKIQHRE